MYNNDFEAEFCQKAWHIISDISEQLSHNQKFAASLLTQARKLKDEAAQTKTGFSLRRFNVDISKETLESELERTNAQLLVENQSLSHENRQLGQLLKEYEQTVDTIMNKLRAHSAASGVYEAELMRYYEQRLSQDLAGPYALSNPHIVHHVHRLARGLHAVLAVLDGKTPVDLPEDFSAEDVALAHADVSEPLQPSAIELPEVIIIPSAQPGDQPPPPSYPPPLYPETPVTISSETDTTDLSSSSSSDSHARQPQAEAAAAAEPNNNPLPDAPAEEEQEHSWAEARELEIDRLSVENARLRALLGIDDASLRAADIPLVVDEPPTLPAPETSGVPARVHAPSTHRPRLSGGVFVPAAWQQAQQHQAQNDGWSAPPGAHQRLTMPVGSAFQLQMQMQLQMQQQQQQQQQGMQQQQQLLQMQAQMQYHQQQLGGGGFVARGGPFVGAGRGGGIGSIRGRGTWMAG